MATAISPIRELPIDLETITALYEEGRYHDAHAAGPAELRDWSGTDARIMAARLAARLGAPRLSQGLAFRAYRDAPEHAVAAYYYASLIHARRGPWHALRWLDERADQLGESADLLSLEAYALGELRDLERAEERLAAARALSPSPWLESERAWLAERRDDVDGALEINAAALEEHPYYRPLLAQRARLLAGQRREEEAYELLGVPVLHQSFELSMQRAEIAFGLRRYEESEALVASASAAATLAEDSLERLLAASRSESAYLCGAHRRAERLARRARTDFCTRFADALAELEDGAAPPRVELEGVPYIRQDDVTCMPASLTSVLHYHGDSVEHAEVAEAICYAGTPLHASGAWARERGYSTRTLDLTFERAVALIDAELPIILSSAGAASAHAHVIVGYDLARRAVLIRDPATPSLVELSTEQIEAQAWSGPWALVVAPADRAEALQGLDLGPSPQRWDHREAVLSALAVHDVAAASVALEWLRREAPGSRQALGAALDLATYEGRVDEQLACLDALLELHPDTPAWILRRGEVMRGRTTIEERITFWERYEELGEPAILDSFAEDLRHHAAHQAKARRLLHRALRLGRLGRQSGMALHVLADLRASRSESDAQTLDAYRFAACLTPADEHFARAYFQQARATGRDREALEFLERRVENAGDRSSGPAQTLLDVYADAGNPERGLEALERLAERRPDDGAIALTLVHAHLSAGDPAAAAGWLERARGRSANEGQRLYVSARFAQQAGDLAGARDALEAALELYPARVEWLGSLADLLLQLEGPAAAIERVERAFAAAPHDGAILGELSLWLSGRDDERRRELMIARLAERPDDDWARRELARVEASLGDLETALERAHEAVARTPYVTSAFTVLGDLLLRSGDIEGARAALRRAVELDVDNAGAIQRLCAAAADPVEARADARFVLDQLERQASAGPGIVEATYGAARLPHDERTERLERLLKMASHRPDAWEAMVRVRLDAGDLEEAQELAERACERFPRWFQARRTQADVFRILGDPAAEEASLRALIELAPAWSVPRARLSGLLRERGSDDLAVAIVEEGLRRSPRASVLLRERAVLHHRAGAHHAALDTLLGALEGGFLDDTAFDTLAVWATNLDRVADVESVLRAWADEFSRSAAPWYRLAVLLRAPDRVDDRVAALEAALERSPRHTGAADLLAVTLTDAGRYDEARAACPPSAWVGPVPHTILGRRAWVLARQGQLEDAVDEMTELLRGSPDYAWGRRQLCDWLDLLGRKEDFLEQAERLVRESPTDAISHVYLADARRLTGDAAGAREAFGRAVQLRPTDPYAVSELLALLLAEGDLDETERLLEWTRHSVPPAHALAVQARVAAARGRWDDALGALDEMLDTPHADDALGPVLDAFEHESLDDALELVESRFEDPAPIAGIRIGVLWAELVIDRPGRAVSRVLGREDALGPAGVSAAARVIELLGMRRRGWALAWQWLWHGRWMRRDGQTWGAFGYALLELGWNRLCVSWLGGFEAREGLQPWMLINLLVAAWALGRASLARRVAEFGEALPRDHASDRHRLWGLFHRALDGDLEGVADEMRRLPASGMDVGLLRLVEALEIAEGAEPGAVEVAHDRAREVERRFPVLGPPIEAVRARIRGG